jgi:hypothetical protein
MLCISIYKNLYFKNAGVYTVQFIGRTSSNQLFAFITSSNISVVTGKPFKLSFLQTVGNVYAAEYFSPYPVVAIADRGDNPVISIKSGNISVSLSNSPTGIEALQPHSNLTTYVVDGTAAFPKLTIQTAGYPYILTFRSSIVSF